MPEAAPKDPAPNGPQAAQTREAALTAALAVSRARLIAFLDAIRAPHGLV
jgi:hypothetical protein